MAKKGASESAESKRQQDMMRVPYHHAYPLGCIELFVALVILASVSLRGAGHVMELVEDQLSVSYGCPAWTTGRLWLLRIGYYQLTRAKKQADDWVWVVDHTVQIGKGKCLLILGVRLSVLPGRDCCLKHTDMEPIELIPVQTSDGKVVYQQLEATVKKTGVPRAILSDHGTDLNAGIEQFCQQHSETASVYDIKHKTAAVLKHALEQDAAWITFTQRAHQTARQVQQTALAALMPPSQKSKARYLNVHELVTWGQAMLALLAHPTAQQDHGLTPDQVQEKLGWLTLFRTHLEEWGRLFEIVSETESLVRHEGLHAGTPAKLERRLRGLAQTPLTRQVRRELLDFVTKEAAKAHPDERLLGSSEIIESVLGKQKRLEQDQSKSGFTGLILGACAMVSHVTQDVILKALETVSTQQVLDWCHELLGPSVQSQRRALFSALDGAE